METNVVQGAVVKRAQLRDGATRRHPLGETGECPSGAARHQAGYEVGRSHGAEARAAPCGLQARSARQRAPIARSARQRAPIASFPSSRAKKPAPPVRLPISTAEQPAPRRSRAWSYPCRGRRRDEPQIGRALARAPRRGGRAPRRPHRGRRVQGRDLSTTSQPAVNHVGEIGDESCVANARSKAASRRGGT